MKDNFQGIIHIWLDTNNGLSINKNNENLHIIIPDNGEVKIKDLSPLAGLHQIIPRYENGVIIPYETSVDPTNIVLYELPGSQGDGYYYFVGSYVDEKVVSAAILFKKLPSGIKFNIQNGEILNAAN